MDNSRYTVYIKDIAENSQCVLIDPELITKAKQPNFTEWIIPDLDYQKGSTYWKADQPSNKKPITVSANKLEFGGYYGESSTSSDSSYGGKYPDCKDIIFDTFKRDETNVEYEPSEIVFQFTIDDNAVSYHSSVGAGFLFDCEIESEDSTSGTTSGYKDYNMKKGYMILWRSGDIQLYSFNRTSENLTTLRKKGKKDGNTNYIPFATTGSTSGVDKASKTGTKHICRLEIKHDDADTTRIVLYEKQADDGEYTLKLQKTLTNYSGVQGSYGVIMVHSASGHCCSCTEYSKFTFDNMYIIEKEY